LLKIVVGGEKTKAIDLISSLTTLRSLRFEDEIPQKSVSFPPNLDELGVVGENCNPSFLPQSLQRLTTLWVVESSTWGVSSTLTKLTMLQMVNCSVDTLFYSLANIQSLILTGCRVSKTNTGFLHLKMLKSLFLDGRGELDLCCFENLHALESLTITNHEILNFLELYNLEALSVCTSLTSFTLSASVITNDEIPFCDLTSLKKLEAPGVTADDIEYLPNLTHLTFAPRANREARKILKLLQGRGQLESLQLVCNEEQPLPVAVEDFAKFTKLKHLALTYEIDCEELCEILRIPTLVSAWFLEVDDIDFENVEDQLHKVANSALQLREIRAPSFLASTFRSKYSKKSF
jgi:hypothetical protein